MAHSLKVEVIPHTNKDGSPSKTRHDYVVTDRTRRGRFAVGTVHNKKDLENMLETYREFVVETHLKQHPNDLAFRRKHLIEA